MKFYRVSLNVHGPTLFVPAEDWVAEHEVLDIAGDWHAEHAPGVFLDDDDVAELETA